MKYRIWILSLVVGAASGAAGEEVRMRYSNGNYNETFRWIQYAHPGTLFTPSPSQYPLYLKTAHFGFNSQGGYVRVKVWEADGSAVGSMLSSFWTATRAWPEWTDVDLSASNIVVESRDFFLSTDDPYHEFFVTFKGATPRQYQGHHFTSQDDVRWVEAYADWAIECTVDTQYGIGVAPASLGRVRALYR